MEHLLILSIVALIASFGLTLASILRRSEGAGIWGRVMLFAGGALLVLYFFFQLFDLGYFPLRTLKDSFVFLALLLVVANALTLLIARLYILNLILAPLASVLLLAAFLFAQNVKSPDALVYLRNALAVLHIPIFILGYAFFVIAAVLSVFYLVMDREMKSKVFSKLFQHFPPLLRIDQYINYFIWLGFILLTLGILTGALFAWQTGTILIYKDTKVVFAFLLWIYYLVYIHNRARGGWIGKPTCYAALLGCALILFAYFSTNFFFATDIHGFR
jgi:ABC-type uncharacterized transport system permease subunit